MDSEREKESEANKDCSMNEEIEKLEDVLNLEDESNRLSVMMEIKDDDPSIYISSQKKIDSIIPGDSAIHLIGIVTNVSDVKEVKAKNRSMKVLNFDMEFENKIKLPISIWDEDIPRLKGFIRLNSILHLDSPYARAQNISSYTYGRNFNITCRSNTIINTLGTVTLNDDCKKADPCLLFTKIDDAVKNERSYNELIRLKCYVKTEFGRKTQNLMRKTGVITDAVDRLNVHLLYCDSDENWEEGVPIEIIGKMVEEKQTIYLEVKSSNDIKNVEGEKLEEEVLEKIFSTPKRKLKENSNLTLDKKLKSSH